MIVFIFLKIMLLKKKLINRYYNNLLFKYFNVTKTRKLFIRKYY